MKWKHCGLALSLAAACFTTVCSAQLTSYAIVLNLTSLPATSGGKINTPDVTIDAQALYASW